MEEIAEGYLHELINRCLIQVADSDRSLEKITKCRVHDLLRDLAVEKAMEVDLFDVYDPRLYTVSPSRRRHAIHDQIKKFFSVGLSGSKLRSLVFFNPDSERPELANLTKLCRRFKYLWVLDLENVSYGHSFGYCRLPDAIGDLIHLKFLGLLRTNFNELPPHVGKLKSLQTLEISVVGGAACILPMEISKLINLRHLYMERPEGLLQINTLTNLRTLKEVSYDQWMDINTINLVNLRELVLIIAMGQPATGKYYSLNSLTNLASLSYLTLISWNTLPPLEPLFSCPRLLRLCLEGKIEKLPPFNKLPQSLTMLRLTRSRLSEDPMPTLEKLLNLRSLDLDEAYDGKEITCSNNGFHQLEYLRLSNLTNLENWRLAETAMPVVRSLSIIGCPKLETIPERLIYIPLHAE